jgi:hypothetical protein
MPNYFLDTEFNDSPQGLQLISIGITDEHGNVLTFYPDEEVATQRGIIKIKDLRESDEILHNL